MHCNITHGRDELDIQVMVMSESVTQLVKGSKSAHILESQL